MLNKTNEIGKRGIALTKEIYEITNDFNVIYVIKRRGGQKRASTTDDNYW